LTTTVSQSEAATTAVGRELARTLQPDAVVLLTGDLGAGKTAFVRGLAEGLGISPAEVTSPTFTLIQEYRGGRLTLYHIDLYRLAAREVDDLGLDDLMVEGGVVAVEWPDRWTHAPADAIRVAIEATGDDQREITIRT
jgi:tRNA threonylcarbamoyladenosine biosynthesis protein TsaE